MDQTWNNPGPELAEGQSPDEILAKLNERYSVREFDGSDIDSKIIDEIVADGLNAPSSCNHQMWHFVVVSDKGLRKKLHETAASNPHMQHASAIVYLCFHKGWNHNKFSVVQSLAAAAYHMMLSAHLRGFGAIWNAGIGNTNTIADLLGIPRSFEIVSALCIGRTKESAPDLKPPRRPLSTVRSWNGFERPAEALYPLKPSDSYPYWEMRGGNQKFVIWDPAIWGWDRIGDFRGQAVFAKSPLPGAYVSRRYKNELDVEIGLIGEVREGARLLEVMPYAGTYTTRLVSLFGDRAEIHFAELTENSRRFVNERVSRETGVADPLTSSLIEDGRLAAADASFDVVFLPQIAEAVPDWKLLVSETARVLKPGGRAVVTHRNALSWFGLNYLLRLRKLQVPNLGPFKPVSPLAVERELRRFFDIEQSFGCSPLPNMVGRSVGGVPGRFCRLRLHALIRK